MFSQTPVSPARTLGQSLKILLWHWLGIVIFLATMMTTMFVEKPRGQPHFHSHFYITTYLYVFFLSACLAGTYLGRQKFPITIPSFIIGGSFFVFTFMLAFSRLALHAGEEIPFKTWLILLVLAVAISFVTLLGAAISRRKPAQAPTGAHAVLDEAIRILLWNWGAMIAGIGLFYVSHIGHFPFLVLLLQFLVACGVGVWVVRRIVTAAGFICGAVLFILSVVELGNCLPLTEHQQLGLLVIAFVFPIGLAVGLAIRQVDRQSPDAERDTLAYGLALRPASPLPTDSQNGLLRSRMEGGQAPETSFTAARFDRINPILGRVATLPPVLVVFLGLWATIAVWLMLISLVVLFQYLANHHISPVPQLARSILLGLAVGAGTLLRQSNLQLKTRDFVVGAGIFILSFLVIAEAATRGHPSVMIIVDTIMAAIFVTIPFPNKTRRKIL
jgi:hypothetical protein